MSSASTPATDLGHAATDASVVSSAEWGRYQQMCLRAAGAGAAVFVLVGVVLTLAGGIHAPRQLFLSYLVAYVYWLGAALGCLVFLMVQYVTGGAWGLVLRRIFEAGASTLIPLAGLFIPILLGVGFIYDWAQPELVQANPELQHKAVWLNVPFFIGRAILYFVLWIGLVMLFRRWSQQQDQGGDGRILERCEDLAAPGILIYALAVTFASIDWVMSLEPNWYSSIYPVMFAVAQLLTGFAFALAVLLLLSDRAPLAGAIKPAHLRDLGSLLFTFVMFWAYMSFSQFLLIWVGNLPEETPWYLRRTRAGWQYVVIVIVILHFALPFFLLLVRDVKENRKALGAVALGLLAIRFLDMFWWIEPAFPHDGEHFYWLLDLSAWVALGGVFLWWFLGQLQSRPLLPLSDPNLTEALHRE